MSVLLALLPIVIIFILLVYKRMAADHAGLIGWGLIMLIAALFFDTPLTVALQASLAGIVASLPITLMVAASILQITIMIESGAIQRVVVLIKTVSPHNQIVQIMMVNIGAGTLLAALGATPVSILPPVMIALGYSSFVAIALPALGYDALCTYALLGIPVVVFANFTGQSVDEVGGYFARYMPVISTSIALGMIWIVGGWKMLRRGWLAALIAGLTAGFIAIGMNELHMVTLTGVAAGFGVVLVMLAYLWISKQPFVDRGVLTVDDRASIEQMPLWRAASPWLILVILAALVNAPFLPFFDLTFNRWAMPLPVIPNAPEKLRILWQAYFWLLVSTLLALPLMRTSRAQMQVSLKKWLKRAPRPMLTSAVFFAIAYVLNHSGKGLDWQLVDPLNNMVNVVATAAAQGLGRFYVIAAPFLGLLGGFISGSETSAIAMLTNLHLSTAEKIGAAGLLIAAASGIGAGLASVISPAKLQNASASIDRIGEEGLVLRTTFVVSLVITAVCALMTLLWVFS